MCGKKEARHSFCRICSLLTSGPDPFFSLFIKKARFFLFLLCEHCISCCLVFKACVPAEEHTLASHTYKLSILTVPSSSKIHRGYTAHKTVLHCASVSHAAPLSGFIKSCVRHKHSGAQCPQHNLLRRSQQIHSQKSA